MKEIEFKDLNLLAIGNTLELAGVVYGDPEGRGVLILLPDEEPFNDLDQLAPTLDEWQKIVRQSDLKEVEIVGDDKNKKIILRKSTRQIDQKIMWEVFRRDSYTCRYCGEDKVPLTVDHVVLWEEGGPSIPINLLCSCKKCNNLRNNMQYEDWINSAQYISRSIRLTVLDRALNRKVLQNIPEVLEKHMRVNKRSR